ncbi:mechanosensitive ion channel family protein [Petrachloros mirabilis]
MDNFIETALLGSLQELARQVLAVLPSILAMVIIISVGLLAAWGVGFAVERLLRVLKLDQLGNSLGVNAALARGGVKADPSRLIGRAAYWVVLLFALIAGLGALNLQPINQFAQSFLGYIPHLLTASIILTAGYLLSNFISQAVLIAAVNASLPPARMLAAASRWGVQLVAVAMALEQLGIAQNIVVVGFAITLGGVVLAAAIAFGLGAKDLAKDYMEKRFSQRPDKGAPDDLSHL